LYFVNLVSESTIYNKYMDFQKVIHLLYIVLHFWHIDFQKVLHYLYIEFSERIDYIQQVDQKETPPTGGVSYLLCSLIKNRE